MEGRGKTCKTHAHLLKKWELRNKNMYEFPIIFQIQFCIHLLADVLIDLNKLNQKLQEDHVDNTSIGTILDVAFSMLCKPFLGGISRVVAMHISSSLIRARGRTL